MALLEEIDEPSCPCCSAGGGVAVWASVTVGGVGLGVGVGVMVGVVVDVVGLALST